MMGILKGKIERVSPCCHTPAWSYINTDKDNWKMTMCKCWWCKKEFGSVDLIQIKEGMNPVLHWCDKCRTTKEELAKKNN